MFFVVPFITPKWTVRYPHGLCINQDFIVDIYESKGTVSLRGWKSKTKFGLLVDKSTKILVGSDYVPL